MSTRLENQDSHYAAMGFLADGDYEYPSLTPYEHQSIETFIQFLLSQNIPSIENLLGHDASYYRFLYLFPKLKQMDDILNGFKTGHPEIDLTTIFEKLEKIVIFEQNKNFIITDGGETRTDKSYERDDETEKPGWVRFYWK